LGHQARHWTRYAASAAIQSDNSAAYYAIKSAFAAGTRSILLFNPSESSISLFNITERIENPYFMKREAKTLFKEFGQDNGTTIEDVVVEDIRVKSNRRVISLY
jgi:hypothetical protein